jgi:hypothetical protein
VFHHGQRSGFEFKYGDAPRTAKSTHSALAELKLERLFAVYPGIREFLLTEKITALPLTEIARLSVSGTGKITKCYLTFTGGKAD